MRIYRVQHLQTKEIAHAVLQDGVFRRVSETLNSMMSTVESGTSPAAGAPIGAEDDVRLLAPATPTKVVCVGLNYQHHADEMGKEVPEEPMLILKPSTAVIATGEAIELPPESNEVHHEGELAVVIGRTGRRIHESEVGEHILGYTCANDVTARDIQRREMRYTRSKGFDTFCPLGPAIATADDFDPADHRLACRVDGEQRQTSTLDDFIFTVPEVISFVSRVMTLHAGDVVLTGTPSGVGVIESGDQVEVEVDGIGTLANPVE